MRVPFLHRRFVRAAAAGVGVIALGAMPALGDLFPRRHKKDCAPPCPVVVETAPATPAKPEPIPRPKPEMKPAPEPAPARVLTDERFAALAAETVAVAGPPNMLGNFIGANGISCTSCEISSSSSNISPDFIPSRTRVFNIADNESPIPRDRAYIDYKYFSTINRDLNQRAQALVAGAGVVSSVPDLHRYTLGVEKTFLEGSFSIGARLPVTTVNTIALNTGEVFGTPTLVHNESSDVGDLAIILKGVLAGGDYSGSLLSAGLLFTIPTGPDTIDFNADPSPIFQGFAGQELYHSITFQPFVGYVIGMGDWFIHGFSAVDFPTDDRDAILMFNDVGIGWYAYRGSGLVTAVVPTAEAHLTTPLTHRDPLESVDTAVALNNRLFLDAASVPHTLVLTYGVTALLGEQVSLGVGFAHPVTGPRPFDYELQFQLNVFFGGPAAPYASAPRVGMY